MDTIMFELCRKDATYVAACIAKQEAEIKRDPKKKYPPAYYALMDKVQEMYVFLSSPTSLFPLTHSYEG
jgi:hypothetical protein